MKFFAAFFALYLLVLSVLPCTDKGICNADQKVQHASGLNHKQDATHDHETEEVCSPLCICACCGQALSTIPLPAPAFSAALAPAIEKPAAFYPPQLLSSYHINIWQPPRAC